MNSELTSDEIPPERYWGHNERLEEWFATVTQQRQARYRGETVEDIPEADDDEFNDGYEIADPAVTALRKG